MCVVWRLGSRKGMRTSEDVEKQLVCSHLSDRCEVQLRSGLVHLDSMADPLLPRVSTQGLCMGIVRPRGFADAHRIVCLLLLHKWCMMLTSQSE